MTSATQLPLWMIGAFLAIALASPPGARIAAAFVRPLRQLPPWLDPIFPAILSLLISGLITYLAFLPLPQFHDEYSYLLAADTYAHGRLTNPPHPMWQHFETFQVLQQPTYMSRYPPGQGFLLAAAKVLTGEPAIGAIFGAALACCAVTWMLAGAMPRRWAIFGGFLCAAHPLLIHWSRSFWGGQLAMAAGAVAIGATLRLTNRRTSPPIRWGILLGLAAFVLAITRPFEGSVLCIILAVALSMRSLSSFRMQVRRVVLPAVCVLLAGGAWLAYDNWRVTGRAMQFPYVLYEKTYAIMPTLFFLPPPAEPAYRIDVMRDFYERWELPQYQKYRSLRTLPGVMIGKLAVLANEYFRPWPILLLLIPLPFIVRKDRTLRWTLIATAAFIIGCMASVRTFAHYPAPGAGLGIFVLIQSARHLAALRVRSRPLGAAFLRAAAMLILTGSIILVAVQLKAEDSSGRAEARIHLMDQVLAQGGHHVILVRPIAGYDYHFEWVYNPADVDAAPVVWARDLGPSANVELRDYYHDRHFWLLTVGGDQVEIHEFPRG